MASITLKHIKKRYHNSEAVSVKDFNLEIKDKEFIVFVGPSGCGKSTTLNMIAGLEDITSGELRIGDRIVNNIPPKNRDIAMVFQNYALYPHMTVYNNMAFGLKLRKFNKEEIDHRIKDAARILGLEQYLTRKPKELSGGQRQRVALGRAIVRDPQVFLMDEPLSNLDAKLRVQMRSEIKKLHSRLQTTTIYVTHDQIEAMTMATRIVIMKDGLIQQVGSPKEVYDSPENIFVGGFIGSPPMNFLNVKIQGDRAVIGDHSIKIPENKMKILREKGYVQKEVILGIRPENLHIEPDFIKASKETAFEVTIEVAELLGAETYLHSTIDNQAFIARVDSRYDVKNGGKIPLAADTNKIHFFDKETELQIR